LIKKNGHAPHRIKFRDTLITGIFNMADYSKFSIKRFRERKLNWIVAPLPVAAVGGGISTGTNLQEVVSMSLHELLGRARGEIARPEGMGIAGVREEIVFFGSPGVVGIVQGFQVAGRR